MIHGLRVTANIDDKVRDTMVFKKKPILAAEQWFIGSKEERRKKAEKLIGLISRYVTVASLGAFTDELINDGLAAQVELVSTDDSDKVGVLVARFKVTLGKLSDHIDPAYHATIVAKYEKILKETL